MIRGIIAYLVFLTILFFFMIFFNNYSFFILFITGLLFPLFDFYITKKINEKLSVKIDTDRTIVNKNSKVPVNIIFENPTIWTTLRCRVKFCVTNNFYLNSEENYLYSALPSKESKVYGFEFSSLYCGNISFKIEEIIVYDFLKIISFKKKVSIIKNITVLPEMKPDGKNLLFSLESQADEEILSRIGSSMNEVVDIRSYIPGDKLQKIHWKLTAKQDEIMVKEYSEDIEYKAVLLVELYEYKENPEILDKLLEVSFSAAATLMDKFDLYMCWYNKNSMKLEYALIEQESDLIKTAMEIYLTPVYEEERLAYNIYKAERDGECTLVYPVFDGEVRLIWE